MALTALTPIVLPGPYDTTPATLTLTAADNVNGNSVTSTGREIIIAQNSDVSVHHVTVTSAADAFGRTADIASFAIPANGFVVTQKFPTTGWQQTDGTLHITTDSALIKLAVLREPF